MFRAAYKSIFEPILESFMGDLMVNIFLNEHLDVKLIRSILFILIPGKQKCAKAKTSIDRLSQTSFIKAFEGILA